MKIKKLMNRRMTSIILCATLLLGICWYPMNASATEEETVVKENIYDNSFNIESFRGEKPSAPEKDGYVFAGWYVKNQWASADETDEEVIYKPLRTDAANAAKNTDEVYAKFVDEKVLGFKFQLNRGVDILSEKTNWRLITSVESLRYDSVGFRIQLGEKVQERDTYKVYKTIQGYVNENETSYTPQEQFAPKSSHFMVMTITNIPDLDFDKNIKVTPKWTTLDGTTVYGEPRSFTFEGVLTESVGENLQSGKGTDFEGFLTHVPTDTFKYEYYHDKNNTGEVKIIYDKSNTYAKLRPMADGQTAKITKACGTNILKAGNYKLSFKVKLGSAVDGVIMFGLFDGSYIVDINKNVIDIPSGANTTDWTTVTGEFTLNKNSSANFSNLDIAYKCVSSSKDNYILIDDIVISSTITNVDANNYGDFENTSVGTSTSMVLAIDKTFWDTYKYQHNTNLEPNSIVKIVNDGSNTYAQLLATESGKNVSLTKSCNNTILKAGTYKISFDVKKGSAASGTVQFRHSRTRGLQFKTES